MATVDQQTNKQSLVQLTDTQTHSVRVFEMKAKCFYPVEESESSEIDDNTTRRLGHNTVEC